MKKQKKEKKKPYPNDLTGGWRRVTSEETAMFRQAYINTFGHAPPPRGRPVKEAAEKYKPISIRLHPAILEWAKREAKKRGVGYQTIINEVLLKAAA
jgi:predicted DNA binding CopG/RHH family protein